MNKEYKIIPQKNVKSAIQIDIDDYQSVSIWLLWSMDAVHKIMLRGVYFSESSVEDRKQYIIETEHPDINPIIEHTVGNHLFGDTFGSSMARRIGGIGNKSVVAHFHTLGKET